MAISTYSELQTAVQNWLARSDSDIAARTPEFITLAETQFNRDVKHRRMETQTTLTLTGGVGTVALPSDFVEIRAMVIESTPTSVLSLVTPQTLAENWPENTSGVPSEYAIIGSDAHVRQLPDSGYDITCTYYARIPALTDAAPTNWMLTYHADMYLYGSLLQAAPYLMNDERVPVWGAFYDRAREGLKSDNDRSAFNGGPLQSTVNVRVY